MNPERDDVHVHCRTFYVLRVEGYVIPLFESVGLLLGGGRDAGVISNTCMLSCASSSPTTTTHQSTHLNNPSTSLPRDPLPQQAKRQSEFRALSVARVAPRARPPAPSPRVVSTTSEFLAPGHCAPDGRGRRAFA
ncbi:hypothetical protein M011DRAFT_332204 [Sporormia fimetaria CBS 119925]|uniref:Uncharacterized protein n=1 Tax=Sporormia fimetaria CBS 119925 TaxID=1340428 RepID=A0A6A6VDH7_9PLEO|nr:hypothetical protein M011DRAFT_332204 [Sporormia fimetaria CBS 119925]